MFDSMMNKLSNMVSSSSKKKSSFYGSHPEFDALLADIISQILQLESYVYAGAQLKFTKTDAYQQLKKFHPEKKADFVLYLQEKVIFAHQLAYPEGDLHRGEKEVTDWYAICLNLFSLLMRSKLLFAENDLLALTHVYIETDNDIGFYNWPIGFTANQIVKHLDANQPSNNFVEGIKEILETDQFDQGRTYTGMDIGAAKEKIVNALAEYSGEGVAVTLFEADNEDKFGLKVNQFLADLPDNEALLWSELFLHCRSSNGARPKPKWAKESKALIDLIDVRKYKKGVSELLDVAASLQLEKYTKTSQYSDGEVYEYVATVFLEEKNRDVLKGLVWTLVRFYDTKTLSNLARLTEKCFQKIPEIGPAAASLGNACIYVLAQSKGMEGISHLSRLKLRIKQNNTQKLIANYIEEQAEKQGLLPSQIEEIAAPSFNLEEGKYEENFDDYTLQLTVTGVGKAKLNWIKPDGKPQKTVPAFVKNNKKQADKLKKLRDIAKQVKQASTAQRDRIDRLYTESRTWEYADFIKFYINHGLVGTIAKKLIWAFKNGSDWTPIFLKEGQWESLDGKHHKLDKESIIRLWHPIHSTPKEVLAWREKLEEWQLQQPMKQAYREVYLLTDAEINTKVYSNRMAAHFIKQHQFNALAAIRGWKYSLMGAYDDGRESDVAVKQLSAHNIKAEFWIYEVYDESESFNDAGIWDYVATDQVRFVGEDDEPIDLVDIDKLLFSEVMRDVDLFVGVASVGNDPQWQDNGGDVQRNYWQAFSFGDLTEIAKTRKAVLERLVPRLKIKDVAQVDGKFLVVKGTRHTYKIHIGSTNILISPNDQYLCIVPSRAKDKNLDNVFLPFEGDKGLSVVLSKAFMLAADDKIKDETILSQL